MDVPEGTTQAETTGVQTSCPTTCTGVGPERGMRRHVGGGEENRGGELTSIRRQGSGPGLAYPGTGAADPIYSRPGPWKE